MRYIFLLLSLWLLSGTALAQGAEDRVGRLLMLAFRGAEAPLDRLEEFEPAGFIIYPGNVESAEQLRTLSRQLQSAAAYPLLLGIDQEGGPFNSYRTQEATIFPGNMALAAAGDPSLATQVARAQGAELAYAGLNMSFGPVLDVNVNPDNPIIGIRSYGADVDTVSRFGAAYAAGLEQAGIAAVVKHFPGHGDTGVDSHLALPSVAGDKTRLSQVELPPFRAALAAGVPAVMTAHVAFPAYEEGTPATLSSAVLTGLLRENMGFDGLVITDYMDMKAIADNYGPGEAAVRSVLAGADLVLLGPNLETQRAVYRALQEAVRSGRLSEARVNRALSRSEAAARRYPLRWDLAEPPREAHRALAAEVATRGATLLWNEDVLPLSPEAELVVIAPQPSLFGEPPHLGSILKRYRSGVRSVVIAEKPSPADLEEALRKAQDADVVILGSYFWLGGYPDSLEQLAARLMATGKPVVLVSLGNPDDLRFLAQSPQAYLAVYGYREANLEAAARVLTGEARPQGRLPVTAGEYPMGSGLQGY